MSICSKGAQMSPTHRIELEDGKTVETSAHTARAAARHAQRHHRNHRVFKVTEVATGRVKAFLRAGAPPPRDTDKRGMWELRHRGAGSMVKLRIPPGKSVYADNSTFLSANKHTAVGTIEQPITGMLTNQSHVLMELSSSSNRAAATVALAPVTHGDVESIDLVNGAEILVRKGAYVASDACGRLTWKYVSEFSRWSPLNLIPTVYALVKGTASKCTVVITGSGSIERIRVTPDNPVKISMGHDLAWSSHLSRSKVSINESLMGMISSLRTQGTVHKFSTADKSGYVWVQTRTNAYLEKAMRRSASMVAAQAIKEDKQTNRRT